MIEVQILKTLSNKNTLVSYSDTLETRDFGSQFKKILDGYIDYFETYPKHEEIDWAIFKVLFFNKANAFIDEKSREEYEVLIKVIKDAQTNSDVEKLLGLYRNKKIARDLIEKLESSNDLSLIKNEINRLSIDDDLASDVVNMDLEEALESCDRTKGLTWRLQCLNDHFNGGLIRGDFGIISGYTDSGKTSFIASEVSHMAQQLTDDQTILWLNNEGDWKRILPRVYCATLNCTIKELYENREVAMKKYREKMGGNKNRIQIIDTQGKSIKDVEKMMKTKNPSLVIFDLLDHLNGFEKYNSKEGSFERYGKLYQWAREMSSQYCPILAVSQSNRAGNNTMWPSITDLRASGVDKQAAAIFVLCIGVLDGDDYSRYLSTPKFKLGGNKSWKVQVKFDPDRSRYND